jgi:putative oxidoreductase
MKMKKIINLYNTIFEFIYQYSNDIFKLFVRLYVANAFFKAGWLKFNNWDSTLYLFEEEYQVPIIPWEFAAYLATAAEIILPILLLLGLASRLIASKLFLFNIMAVVSYPVLWNGGFYDHKLWGVMLLVTVIFGPGKFAADSWIFSKKP